MNQVWALLFLTSISVALILWWNYRKDPVLGNQLTLSRWFLFVVARLSTGENGMMDY